MKRKWLPTFAELIDRLSIHQLKEVFIPDQKDKFASEMNDIVHDLNLIIKENDIKITGQLIRAIVVLAQINAHLWYNETDAKDENKQEELLRLTYSLNGVRNNTMNIILDCIGSIDRKDYKIDHLSEEFSNWEPSL